MSQSYPAGILPYGSSDPSIIFKCSLQSLADIAAPAVGPAGTVFGTGHTVGALGFHPAASGNSGVTFSNIPGHLDLDRAGQISFECDSYTLTAEQASSGSSGWTPLGTEWFLTWDDGATAGWLRKISLTNFDVRLHPTDPTIGVALLHSQERPANSYSRVTLSWRGAKVDLWIDGYLVTPNVQTYRVNFLTAAFKNLNILSHISGVNPSRVSYMRNILVSTKPVSYPIPASSSSVCLFGHSFANANGDDNNTTSNLDGQLKHKLRKYYASLAGGIPGDIFTGGIGGGYVDTALIADANFHLSTKVVAAMKLSPQKVVVLAGTNDVNAAAFSASAFETAFKSMMTSFATGLNAANISKIVVCTVCSVIGLSGEDNPTTEANITAANATINALPAWWDATYPALSGRLVIADTFAAWGGARPTQKVMIGQLLGSLANLHPSPLGNDLLAKCIVNKMKA